MNPTRIDSFIGIISPAWMSARLAAREHRTKLSYEAARSGRERPPPQPLRGPDNIIHQLESVAMIQRAEELARDSSFIKSIIDRFKMHVVGNLQYIPQVGTRKENALYREFWQKWAKKSDITRRFHFVDQMNMGVSGCLVQGDHGIIHHHHGDGTFQIQNVEGENIGNPRQVVSGNNHVIRGVVIDANGAPVAYRIYKQTVNSQFIFVDEVPASHFSHLNPVTRSDEYKAKTPFHAVLNDAADFRRIEKAWLNKIQWAGFKVGQINTANGMAPQPSTNYLDEPSNSVTRGRLQPMAAGEVLYGEPGMEVKMIEGKTPSPEEMEFMIVKLQQIAGALNLPLPFVYVMMGLPGTYTRLIGEWASRTFEDGPIGQRWLQRTALDEIKNKALLSGIMRNEIPYVKNWDKGQWMFPARSSVDVGRESDANLKENAQGIRSMADICAEEGRYWDDVDQELEYEAESKMERAIRTAQRITASTGVAMTWQDVMPHIQMMGPNPTPKDAAASPVTAQSKPAKSDESNSEELAEIKAQFKELRTQFKSWEENKHNRKKDGEFAPKGDSEGGKDAKSTTQRGTAGASDRGESSAGKAARDVISGNSGADTKRTDSISVRDESERAALKNLHATDEKSRSKYTHANVIGTGQEHIVEDAGDRVLKHTKGGFGYKVHPVVGPYGGYATLRVATPGEYLDRMDHFNHAFGDDSRLEGVLAAGGSHIGLTVSQKKIKGTEPTQPEIDDYLKKGGYVKVAADKFENDHIKDKTWINPKSGYVVTDVKPDNFKKTPDGKIVPIDLIVDHAPEGSDLHKALFPQK